MGCFQTAGYQSIIETSDDDTGILTEDLDMMDGYVNGSWHIVQVRKLITEEQYQYRICYGKSDRHYKWRNIYNQADNIYATDIIAGKSYNCDDREISLDELHKHTIPVKSVEMHDEKLNEILQRRMFYYNRTNDHPFKSFVMKIGTVKSTFYSYKSQGSIFGIQYVPSIERTYVFEIQPGLYRHRRSMSPLKIFCTHMRVGQGGHVNDIHKRDKMTEIDTIGIHKDYGMSVVLVRQNVILIFDWKTKGVSAIDTIHQKLIRKEKRVMYGFYDIIQVSYDELNGNIYFFSENPRYHMVVREIDIIPTCFLSRIIVSGYIRETMTEMNVFVALPLWDIILAFYPIYKCSM